MVIIHATLPIRPESRDEFLAAVPALIETTNAEPGVVDYRLYEAVHTPNEFIMVEHYVDDAGCDAHLGSEHLGAVVPALGGWLSAAPTITRYTAAEGSPVHLG